MNDSQAKVFVTQLPHKLDKDTNTYVPTVNLTPAAEHGEVQLLMPHRAPFHATGDLVKQMREKLKGYDFEAGDAIIPLGDPAVMAAAAALLGAMFGKFTVLKWDRNMGRYVRSVINVQ